MRLGNDIVDLSLTAEHNPRFVERIVSPAERRLFPSLSLTDPLLWKLWAAKEAAYKAIKQKADIPFHHREFVVNAGLNAIVYHGQILQLALQVQGDFIFAVVTDLPWDRVSSRIYSFDQEVSPAMQSQKARDILMELAAETLRIPLPDLSIQTEDRIPKIHQQGQRLDHPISLTHHGRAVAVSLGRGVVRFS